MNLLSKEIFVVAMGGAFGSVARLLLSRFVQIMIPFEGLPWGIIIVNILGCFAIGVVYGFFELKMLMNPLLRVGIIVGILGGFTTFSSFSLDTFHFLLRGEIFSALLNILISVGVCLLATVFGAWCVTVFV